MSTRDLMRGRRPKVVQVDLGGGKVYVRGMNGATRAAYIEMAKDGAPPSFKIAALGICEESGNLSYNFQNPHDLEELREVDGSDLDKIVMAIFDASGLGRKAEEAIEKKSEMTPSGSGGTAELASSTAQ